jgi:hypothetical protein
MKPVLWLLLAFVIGGSVGWYIRGFSEQEVRAATKFSFTDNLADRQVPYVSAQGSWRGGDLASKINTAEIVCFAHESNCDVYEADVLPLSRPLLSLSRESFQITKIDAQSVIAESISHARCIRETLSFDRVAKAVTLVRTKINREDACSMLQNEPVTFFLGEPLSQF